MTKKTTPKKSRRLTRAQAIRAKCLGCTCQQRKEVELCDLTDCSLWTYRMGYEVDRDTGERVVRKTRKGTKGEEDE